MNENADKIPKHEKLRRYLIRLFSSSSSLSKKDYLVM